MNEGFWSSWGLFQWTYIGALAASAGLGALGVLVIGRGRVFLTAAIGQVGALGFAVALLIGGPPAWVAMALSMGASWMAELRGQSERMGEVRGETEVWLFLTGQVLATVLMAGHPQGLKAVQAAMTSSLTNTQSWEAVVALVLALGAVGWTASRKRVLTLFLSDPVTAAAVGISARKLGLGIALATGLALGWLIPTYGFLFVFSAVTLPAIIARNSCRTIGTLLWLAPVVGVSLCAIGLAVGYTLDWPFGQAIVVTHALAVPLSWGARAWREWYSGA